MSAQINERVKPVPISMRVGTRQRSLIDAAVALLGTDAACRRAEQVIMDRQLFLFSDDAFRRFEQALERNALKDNKCLHELMFKPTPWS
ncbi:MAG: DUF1778 domain-containing protein [Pseudomonas putida]